MSFGFCCPVQSRPQHWASLGGNRWRTGANGKVAPWTDLISFPVTHADSGIICSALWIYSGYASKYENFRVIKSRFTFIFRWLQQTSDRHPTNENYLLSSADHASVRSSQFSYWSNLFLARSAFFSGLRCAWLSMVCRDGIFSIDGFTLQSFYMD